MNDFNSKSNFKSYLCSVQMVNMLKDLFRSTDSVKGRSTVEPLMLIQGSLNFWFYAVYVSENTQIWNCIINNYSLTHLKLIMEATNWYHHFLLKNLHVWSPFKWKLSIWLSVKQKGRTEISVPFCKFFICLKISDFVSSLVNFCQTPRIFTCTTENDRSCTSFNSRNEIIVFSL